MRYAIGKKPSYYKTYEGITYITQEEYDSLPHDDDKIKFTKTAPPAGLDSKNWWSILEWAKYYAYCCVLNEGGNPEEMPEEELLEYYPTEEIYTYGSSSIEYLTMDNIINNLGSNYFTTWRNVPAQILLFKQQDNRIRVDTHYLPSVGYGCEHYYTDFMPGNPLGVGGSNGYYAAYIYSPTIPEAEGISAAVEDSISINDNSVIICDWREIIYQMAKDYRKHNHEDDFYVQVRKNNGRDLNGEWRYPKGITTYEPFYIDLEGFWRQLYCPPGLGGGDMKDVIIQNGKLY